MAAGELKKRIARLIAGGGPLSIAQFMTIALHDPIAGYYATHDPLGQDFITAPEISQAFGELLGLWCVQAWRDQGAPAPARLVEFGPGRGTLMADVLRAAQLAPEFLAAIDVLLVENSLTLAEIQRSSLRDCEVPMRWVKDVAELDYDRPTFLLANEFFDALPVAQYVFTKKGWCERMITADSNDDLSFVLAPAPRTLAIPSGRGVPPPGAVFEVSSSAIAIVEDVARGISRAGGAALIVDYGHCGEGFGETLQAVGRHSFQDLLSEPGAVDISAHVDFAMMARAARAAGAAVYGPVPLSDFLGRLGIRERRDKLRASRGSDEAASGIDRLIDAQQLGTLFKVLAILPKHAPPPEGLAT